jgi:peptidyl-prolyl cis-trans isomerase C
MIAALGLLLVACGARQQNDADAALAGSPAGTVVARVNGEAITEPVLDVFAKGRGLDPADATQRQRALDLLIENVLLAQDAAASGLVERPEVRAELVLVHLQQLAGRNLAHLREDVEITDAELRAYYEREAERTGGIELNLQHILFADEASALAAVARAQLPDADFVALMGEYAAGGALQARDLGWANLGQLPKEVAEVAATLPDGAVAAAPVQTSFGWHVLRRVASRPFSPPPFEQVRDGARRQLMEQAVADKVKALREQAAIEIPAQTQGS